MGENGPGDAYGLWLGQCNGTCERAPMIWVDGRVAGPLSMTETVKLARRVKHGEPVVDWPERPIKIAPAVFQNAEEIYGPEHGERAAEHAEEAR